MHVHYKFGSEVNLIMFYKILIIMPFLSSLFACAAQLADLVGIGLDGS